LNPRSRRNKSVHSFSDARGVRVRERGRTICYTIRTKNTYDYVKEREDELWSHRPLPRQIEGRIGYLIPISRGSFSEEVKKKEILERASFPHTKVLHIALLIGNQVSEKHP